MQPICRPHTDTNHLFFGTAIRATNSALKAECGRSHKGAQDPTVLPSCPHLPKRQRSKPSRCHQSKPLANAVALGAAHTRAGRCIPRSSSSSGAYLAQPRQSRFSVWTAPRDTSHICAALLGTGLHSPYSTLCIKIHITDGYIYPPMAGVPHTGKSRIL